LESGRVLGIEADKRSLLRWAGLKTFARDDEIPTPVRVADLGPLVLEGLLQHDAKAFGDFRENGHAPSLGIDIPAAWDRPHSSL
jgi:hypothetical protein